MKAAHWPYPLWIAHRGAGKLAPENTLAAFRLGAAHGYHAFECDVKLSADGVPFLMHDATLSRTTNFAAMARHGAMLSGAACGHPERAIGLFDPNRDIGGTYPWAALSQLDAGAWHSRAYAGEPLPTLAGIAGFCLANQFILNIEIKPTPGLERLTGEIVGREAACLWAGQAIPPLLTSFQPQALEGARATAPGLPRGFLLDEFRPDWLAVATQLGCAAIVCNYTLWDAQRVSAAQAAGLRCLSYTVNDAWAAQHLMALGTDGIITDRVDLFSPA